MRILNAALRFYGIKLSQIKKILSVATARFVIVAPILPPPIITQRVSRLMNANHYT